ncbi:MAG: arginine--tRNA ligase [Clostridia bacterium]|nr:arginine--tRNA ligase [Clostridia bacterium]
MNYKEEIAKKINAVTNVAISELEEYIEIPPNPEMGDYAFPCFKLAKELRKAPPAIATELKENIVVDGVIEKIEVAGGYLNFFVNKSTLVVEVLKEVLAKGEDYGKSDIGNGKTIVIDYSSPNIAKPFHIGHLRTTVIGGALYKMYKFLGYHVVGINHLGDWGMGISKTIAGYEMWKEEYSFDENPIMSILAIYVRFNKLEKEDPSYTDKARDVLIRLENKDEETTKLWRWIIEISLENYQKVYDLLGSEFDSYNGEAFYNDKMDRVIKELEEKNLLVDSEGAKVVEMPDNMPPCIIITSAGTTIYATRDLAALLYRIDNYDFSKALYVVGSEQSLHFKQVFKTLELMGYEKYAKNCEHISFGLILDENGEKIGSRKGGHLLTLEEILNESIEKSRKIIEEKNPELDNKEEVAKMVGVGAIIFNDLSNNRVKDEIFDWNQILNFAGETGPYLQYTYVRTQSILRNAGIEEKSLLEADFTKLLDKEGIDVIKLLGSFETAVVNATNKNEPSIISRYLIDVAQSFSRFYNEHQIICEEEETKKARVALTKAVGTVVKTGLSILGIKTPEKM